MTRSQRNSLFIIFSILFCSFIYALRPQVANVPEVHKRLECQRRLVGIANACKKFKEQKGNWPFENPAKQSAVTTWQKTLMTFLENSGAANEVPHPFFFQCENSDSGTRSSFFPVILPDGEYGLICGVPNPSRLLSIPMPLKEFVDHSNAIHVVGFILLRLNGKDEGQFSYGKTYEQLTFGALE
jgi:hypothetical protein